jgi:DNA-binding response OmpR family regulator
MSKRRIESSEEPTVPTTILFVAICADQYRNKCLARFREAGLLPVTVTTVDAALAMLRQFSVAAVLLPAASADNQHWESCARLMDTGTPVVLLAHHVSDDRLNRLLAAGYAAILIEPYTTAHLQVIIRRIGSGERGIVWADMAGGAAVST